MADAVAVLRQEISTLEHELAKRRSALALLTGAGAAKKRATTATKQPQTAGKGVPSLSQRIESHLTANRGKLFSTAEIADALAKVDKTVTRDNVQRRVSDLVKRKKVRRNEGRYGMA